jgi:RHS repeat-associated protein
LTNMKFNAPDPTIENPTTFEKEKTINFDHLHNILNIVENFNGQTKTITTDIPENSVYSKLNQYASFDQWGLDYDKKGNTTQRGTQQLAYDYRNQLVTANDAPANTQVEMKYDVLGRRTQKSVTIGSQTKIENYYHSGQQVIEVRDENDQVLRQYIYGNGIDEIIRMDKFEGDTFTSYYYHTDANGSVTAITDADGNLVERVTYDLYGMPTFWDAAGNKISKSSIGNNILFHGREYDAELNLYYFRARYYCPIMGRFLQTDPMGYQDSLNLYQGFYMNPMNFTDPFGKSIREILKLQFEYYEYLMDVEGWSEEAAHKEARNQSQILIARWKMSLEMKQAIKDLAYENFRKNLYCGAPVANLDEIESIYNYISNFGTRTGEAISNWLRNKDFENFLIMATTAWGEAGEAFLAVIGGVKGYRSLRTQYKSIQNLDARFEAFVKGKYGQFKDWYKLNKNRLQSGHIGNSPRHIRKNIKDIEAWDEIETFLGSGRSTDINPFTGLKDPNRIFVQQADGTWRSVRIGAHEMGKEIGSGFHYHLEEWRPSGTLVRPDQSVNVLKTSRER